MVDRQETPRVVDCFIVFFYTIELHCLSENEVSFVLSSERENQTVVTIRALLHHIHVEF